VWKGRARKGYLPEGIIYLEINQVKILDVLSKKY
jgi:hypothetical protein